MSLGWPPRVLSLVGSGPGLPRGMGAKRGFSPGPSCRTSPGKHAENDREFDRAGHGRGSVYRAIPERRAAEEKGEKESANAEESPRVACKRMQQLGGRWMAVGGYSSLALCPHAAEELSMKGAGVRAPRPHQPLLLSLHGSWRNSLRLCDLGRFC